MFGYSMAVRSLTSGQASFSMEFAEYQPVPSSVQEQLIARGVR
ncbi:MAG TPA: elongation factor G, partial [Cyanobacteria bacterium UBA8553]|nr:elongation factor G [Cyanobacteria bacterium UBA8553]